MNQTTTDLETQIKALENQLNTYRRQLVQIYDRYGAHGLMQSELSNAIQTIETMLIELHLKTRKE